MKGKKKLGTRDSPDKIRSNVKAGKIWPLLLISKTVFIFKFYTTFCSYFFLKQGIVSFLENACTAEEKHQEKMVLCCRPVLWGDAAVSYLEVKQHMGPSLIETLKLKQVVDHIDPSIMEASVLHFPLLRTADVSISFCRLVGWFI